MLTSIKRFVLVGMICCSLSFTFTGCTSFEQHELDNDPWITEQVKNGTLTEEEAQQMRNIK